jgi:hypothetical protein
MLAGPEVPITTTYYQKALVYSGVFQESNPRRWRVIAVLTSSTFIFITVIKHTCVTLSGIVLRHIPISHLSRSSSMSKLQTDNVPSKWHVETDSLAAITQHASSRCRHITQTFRGKRIMNSYYRRRRMLVAISSLLLVYWRTVSITQTIQRRVTGWLVNNESERIWKEVVFM